MAEDGGPGPGRAVLGAKAVEEQDTGVAEPRWSGALSTRGPKLVGGCVMDEDIMEGFPAEVEALIFPRYETKTSSSVMETDRRTEA